MTKVFSIHALHNTKNIPNHALTHYSYSIEHINITPKTIAGAVRKPEFARKIIVKQTKAIAPAKEVVVAKHEEVTPLYFVVKPTSNMDKRALAEYFDNARNAAALDSEIWTMGVVAEIEKTPETISYEEIHAFVAPRRIAANTPMREMPAKPETKFYDEPADKKKAMTATGLTLQDYICEQENNATRKEINDSVIVRFLKDKHRIHQAFNHASKQRRK